LQTQQYILLAALSKNRSICVLKLKGCKAYVQNINACLIEQDQQSVFDSDEKV